jgi:hypothetical protein
MLEDSGQAVWAETPRPCSLQTVEVAMSRGSEPFVHVLLFECPSCGAPIASAIATGERNPEEADARSFVLHCSCGWTGIQMGLQAKRHWVETWH